MVARKMKLNPCQQFLVLVVAVICVMVMMTAAVTDAQTPAPFTTLGTIDPNVTIANWEEALSILTANDIPRVCIRAEDVDRLDYRFRPCIKTYYEDSASKKLGIVWNYYSSKYYYICNKTVVTLMQCGNEWPRFDFAGDDCKPESDCVVRAVFNASGVYTPGHEILDKNVRWSGVKYNIKYYLKQQTWGHDINLRGRMCETPIGIYDSPRLSITRPASQKVCLQRTARQSMRLDCGNSGAEPILRPQELYYDNSGRCEGAARNETWGFNNSCYRAPGLSSSDGSHGPRWSCFPGNFHYGIIFQVQHNGAAPVTSVMLLMLFICAVSSLM